MVLGVRLRRIRSSVMRRRNGVMASSLVGEARGRDVHPPVPSSRGAAGQGAGLGTDAGRGRPGERRSGLGTPGGDSEAARGVAFGPPRSGLVVCRACSTAWGCKSPTQPDGGEVLAKRKGVAARQRPKAAWSKTAT